MLAFLKRWRKAYLEDKGNRLHAEAEFERNAQKTLKASKKNTHHKRWLNAWASASDELYEEGCRRGYH